MTLPPPRFFRPVATDGAASDAAHCACGAALDIARMPLTGQLKERCVTCRSPWRVIPRRLGALMPVRRAQPSERIARPKKAASAVKIVTRRARLVALLPVEKEAAMTLHELAAAAEITRHEVHYDLRCLINAGRVAREERPTATRMTVEHIYWKVA